MNELVKLTETGDQYSSLVPTSREEQKLFFNAVDNPTEKLSKYINKRIKFVNVFMERIDMIERDDEGNPTGVVNSTIKTVLITPDGNGVISTSMGIARALMTMFRVFGTPDTWDEPMECIVEQVEIGKNRTFKFKVV